MQQKIRRHAKYFILTFLVLFFLGGRPVEFGQEKTFFQGFLIKNPVIRIGLGVNLSDIAIQSSSGMKVYEVRENYKLVANDVDEIHIRGRKEKLTEKFLLQVALMKGREEAEVFAQEIRAKMDYKVYVEEDTESTLEGIYQVKVGDFMTRGEALQCIKKLNEIGVGEAWILQEEITEEDSKPLWILVEDELKSLSDDTVLYFVPSHAQSFLSYKGLKYRGIFVLRASRKGLVLVNILNLENYLKGVVPSELSPYKYDELEALKAQAVAARTYAIKNLKMNENLGFDLCDTQKTQVYRGLSAEHPLSTKSVTETEGEVALYRGKLINALYTSTCGGITENAENVFGGNAVPYLESIECTHEKNEEWTLNSKTSLLPIEIDGKRVEREIASLISLKAIPAETNPSYYRQNASREEALDWIKKSIALAGKKHEIPAGDNSLLSYPALAPLLIDAFGWRERVENLLLKSEAEHIMRDFPQLAAGEKEAMAYLILSGIFPPHPEIAGRDRPMTRAELAFCLYKMVASSHDLFHKGVFKELNKNEAVFLEAQKKKPLLLPPSVFLFRNQDGERSPATRLSLFGGEDVRWIEQEGEVKFLEIIFPPNTNILDRSSPFHRWLVRLTREDVEKRVNQFYPIGRLLDITVKRRGNSKRATELAITGTGSHVVVKGLRIRWVLGLKDTLFIIDREYDEAGQVTHFTFSGKGWGHGVGLCQVGAFQMARSGAEYKEILKKYYRGIKIDKIL